VTVPGTAPDGFDGQFTADPALSPEQLGREIDARVGALERRMGIHITSASAQQVSGTLPVEGNTQPFGLLHGGASVVLAETLGSVLAALNAPPGRNAVGVDINATHHRSAADGTVTGTATVLAKGRTTVTSAVAIVDEQGRPVCSVRITCYLREIRGSSATG
jgi:1,4-dihydroxy-2-naphthoyl-CoA hydrolase